jgi:hypothetical protein
VLFSVIEWKTKATVFVGMCEMLGRLQADEGVGERAVVVLDGALPFGRRGGSRCGNHMEKPKRADDKQTDEDADCREQPFSK